MKILRCLVCQGPVTLGWRYCGACGHRLCRVCGHPDGYTEDNTDSFVTLADNEKQSVHADSFAGRGPDGNWWCRECNRHEMAGPCL